MTPQDRKTHGAALRQARRQRVHDIRRRVLASATALFVAVWMLIAVTLVSGHDPALARKTGTTVASTQAAAGTSTGTGAGTSTTTGASGTTSSTTAAAANTTSGTSSNAGTTASGTSSLTSAQS